MEHWRLERSRFVRLCVLVGGWIELGPDGRDEVEARWRAFYVLASVRRWWSTPDASSP